MEYIATWGLLVAVTAPEDTTAWVAVAVAAESAWLVALMVTIPEGALARDE